MPQDPVLRAALVEFARGLERLSADLRVSLGDIPVPEPQPSPPPSPLEPPPQPLPPGPPPTGFSSADIMAVSRLRQGGMVQIVPFPRGHWRIDHRKIVAGKQYAVDGPVAPSLAEALRLAETMSTFPKLPESGVSLSSAELAALEILSQLGAKGRCSVRFETNGTHSEHNWFKVNDRWPGMHWEKKRGLIVEPVEWLASQRSS